MRGMSSSDPPHPGQSLVHLLQVEPVRWSKERQRKVLHAAVSSVVTSEMIRAATFAVSTGYCGSLSRRTSSRADVSYTMLQLLKSHALTQTI